MNILVVENLTKTYGERVLFENISFGLEQGKKVALVARNGAGKSSLLKILSGQDVADSGKISINNNASVGFLEQEPFFNDDDSIIDHIFMMQTPQMLAVKEYERLQSIHDTDPNSDNEKLLQDAITEMEDVKAWDIDARVKTVLGKLGLHHIHQSIKTLSGGQKRRVALAQLLIEAPDLIFMD